MKVNKSSSSTVREEHQENSLRPAASQVRAGRALPLGLLHRPTVYEWGMAEEAAWEQ